MATTPMYIVYHPGILGLVPDSLSSRGVDSDVYTKVSYTDNVDSLVLAPLASILVELLFLSRVSLMLLAWEWLTILRWLYPLMLIFRLLIVLI